MMYPISFSIPRHRIVDTVPEKTKVLATCIPGKADTYIFNTLEDYDNDYRRSMYALTTVKGGWDCYRHYEILANGAIPLFPGLETCPSLTMTTFPKQLIQEANASISKDPSRYAEYANKLLEYTRNHLTTEATASYVLAASGITSPKEILYISESWPCGIDYLRCLTLHGFKELFGAKCHDYPRVNHLYTDYTGDCNQLWGRGYGCSKFLDPSTHDNDRDQSVEDDIRNKRYDCVIFASVHRGLPLWELVRQHYPPQSIILFCGEDFHVWCPLDEVQYHECPRFRREIPM
jgi:hypothetical protein